MAGLICYRCERADKLSIRRDVYNPGCNCPPSTARECPKCAGSGWTGHGMGGDTCGTCGGKGFL